MIETLTFAAAAHLPVHWSAFRRGLLARAGGAEQVSNWLIAQANARGFHGAFVDREEAVDPALGLEDLVVGLLMPHAELDARIIKLVVRILQAGQLDPVKLAFRARRERADIALAWVLSVVPETEKNAALDLVSKSLRTPRGGAQIRFNYDSERLVRRPATKQNPARAKRRLR